MAAHFRRYPHRLQILLELVEFQIESVAVARFEQVEIVMMERRTYSVDKASFVVEETVDREIDVNTCDCYRMVGYSMKLLAVR